MTPINVVLLLLELLTSGEDEAQTRNGPILNPHG